MVCTEAGGVVFACEVRDGYGWRLGRLWSVWVENVVDVLELASDRR